MMVSFYKQKPNVDTPYRKLVLEQSRGWQVRLSGGTKWGEHAEELKVILAKSFEEAVESFNRVYAEVQAEGWKAYSPYEPW